MARTEAPNPPAAMNRQECPLAFTAPSGQIACASFPVTDIIGQDPPGQRVQLENIRRLGEPLLSTRSTNSRQPAAFVAFVAGAAQGLQSHQRRRPVAIVVSDVDG